MGLLPTDELTLATLANELEGTPTGCPLSRLRTVATRETGRLSRQVELTVAIQQFVTDGLVEQTAGPDEERLLLTPSGRYRANAVLDDLMSREITVVDNTGEQTLTVDEAATEFECSPVEIAAACSADGTYYHRDEAIEYDLLGRDEATARFERALDHVNDRDNGTAVVVTGPGGIGKTTFVEAMLDRTASSVAVHSARCRETPEVGFQPLRDIFAGLDGESFPVIGVEAEDVDVYERQQAGLFHDVTERLVPDDEQTRVLFLDDVDLADGATWDYLEYLAGRLADLPVVLILAHRSGTLPRPVFGTDAEDGGTGPEEGHIEPTRIELSGLTREETERLIEQVIDRRGVPAAFADAVYDRTGGNPLFVETTVEAMLESQQLDPEFQWYPEHAADIDLPDAVGETIIRQLDILDDDAKTVLEWAALAGESIPEPVLVTVCGLPERRTRALVETLVEAGLFDRPSGSIERVTFQSNVVREAILDVIEDGRADRHVTVADAFVECAGTDDTDEREFAATIAYQYEQGGDVDDAISWYERAAERATESYAHETAIEHYMHVLDLARSVDDYGTLCETGLEIATVALTTSDYDRAARYVQFVEETDETGSFAAQVRWLAAKLALERGEFTDAVSEAKAGLDQCDSDDRACHLLSVKAKAEWYMNEYADAEVSARECLALAEELEEDTLVCDALRRLGQIQAERSEFDRAEATYEQALERAEDQDKRHRIATIENGLGIVKRRQDESEASRRYYESALETAEAVGDRHLAAKLLNNLAVMSQNQGDIDQSVEYLERALTVAETIGDRHLRALVQMNLGLLARIRADFRQSRAKNEQAKGTFEELGSESMTAIALLNIGTVERYRGNYATATELLEEAHGITAETGNDYWGSAITTELGHCWRNRGAYDRARESFAQVTGDGASIDSERRVAGARLGEARVAFDTGAFETARNLANEAVETIESEGTDLGFTELANGLKVLGLAQGACGKIDEARASLDRARGRYAGRTSIHNVALVDRALGRVAFRAGDYDLARTTLQDTLDVLTDLDLGHEAARTRTLLGAVALETGNYETAREYYERAFETFETGDAPQDTLDALDGLVRIARATGDDTAADRWQQRATDHLKDAPAAVREQHSEWVESGN